MQRTSIGFALKGLIESIRQWIDRSDHDDLDDTLQTLPPARLREREQIVKRIVFAIADRLEREAAALPGKPLLIPPVIEVYLDEDENVRWVNQARRWLIEGIKEATEQRVREMQGFDSARTQIPRVDLREDSKLEPGEIRVETAWVSHRVKKNQASTAQYQLGTLAQPVDGEPTVVEDSASPLYQIEIWREGARVTTADVRKNQIVVGRGTPTNPVDVQLVDPAVSRVHATVDKELNGYWITSIGTNRLRVNGRALHPQHRTKVRPGDAILIGRFTLRIAQIS